ncbi:hypothetical protein [Neobacillus sp. LXY-1]|uniref:hypothetical protein n=1 Tax=Neobacillus sp. LXY-1 TaxID=3379133 RepID=UPI003EDFFBBD
MDWKSFFTKDVKEYIKLKKILEELFHLNKEIPDQVFQRGFNNYLFEQFDFIMSEEFWTTIRDLAEKSNDDFVVLAVLNPHPMDYYYKEFGYFNWLKLPIDISSVEFLNILNEGPPNYEADAIFINSFIIALFSPSKKWGIWADRNYEIAIIASDKEININLLPILDTWVPVEDNVVMDWTRFSFRHYKVPKSFSKKLRMNYSNLNKNSKDGS